MIGYKAFNKGLVNSVAQKFEVGKTYSVEGKLTFGSEGNGYHFCINLTDVYRYFKDMEGIEVAIVSTEDKDEDIIYREDEYNAYYMYVCRTIKIEKVLSRKEIIDTIISYPNYLIKHFIETNRLSKEECCTLSSLNNEIDLAIQYSQYQDKEVYYRLYNIVKKH